MLDPMPPLGDLFRPPSLGIAVVGAAVSGLALVGIGIASLASNHAMFSAGIGAVLIGYGLVVLLGAWLGWRRHPLARGLIVAPAILHIATAVSLIQGGDTAQTVGAVSALVVFLATAVAGIWPATHRALSRVDQPPEPESR